MEGIKEASNNFKNIDSKNPSFFAYIFNFDRENKDMMMNYFQYALIALPLVILSLKSLNYLSPIDDPDKGTLEIIGEVLGSVSFILIAIWFINKIIRYIPNYSQTEYPEFNEINFIVPLFIVLFTMQTKLGSKINILFERLYNMISGTVYENTNSNNNEKKNSYQENLTNQQPLNPQNLTIPPVHQPSQSDYLNQVNYQNPVNNSTQANYMNQATQAKSPNFNSMFKGPTTPLVEANTPGMSEPMAANEAFGTSFGSSFMN